MQSLIVYVHGKGGSAEEAAHYRPLFPGSQVVGFDYHAQTPWEAREEFPAFFRRQHQRCGRLILIANSIGAFFALSSLDETLVDRAYFISPVVDMERLIRSMMQWAHVTEQELADRGRSPRTWARRCPGRTSAMCGRTPSHGASPPVFCTASMTR